MKKILLLFSFFFLTAVFFFSCRKENKNPSWDVDVLVPLVKSTLTINNIIPDSLLHINSDNTLDIVYRNNLSSFNADSIFLIPDTVLDTIIVPPTATLSPCTYVVNSANDQTKYNLGSVELSKVIIRSGMMKIKITNATDGDIEYNYKLPLTKISPYSAQYFDTTFIVPKRINASTPGVFSADIDMSGYVFDLTGLSGSSFNTLVKTVSIRVPCNGPILNLNFPNDYIKMENSFIDIVPEYAKGYFGSTVTAAEDTTDFSLFNHVIDGTLNLEDMDIDFSIENSVGADARVTIDNLTSINTRTGNTVPLTHPIINSPININRAADNAGNVISSLYKFSITPSSPSNILSFVNNMPDKMSYKMNFEINPLGNVSGGNDFIYYSKLLKTQMDMTIPLSLIANNLTMADTMDFKMDANTDNVNYGNLYLYADNGFPFTAQVQLYLMDNNFTVTDSLISMPNTILAPLLDANYVCEGKKFTKLTIPADADKMEKLHQTHKIYLKIKFNTAGQPNYVKIYSFYEINVKLAGDFNYTVGKN